MAEELRALARFTCRLRLEDLPEPALDAARRCVLDNLGAALGAAESPEIRSILQAYEDWAGLGKNGLEAAAWGQGRRTGLFNALLCNGLLSHELELDDVHTGSKSHVGAVVIPAAWTLADALGAGGRAFLEAVAAGYEVMGRVGLGMDVASNRKRGWHTTGVIGTFGAAAAAARLLGLNEDQTLSAFGMAGTQSSGLWAFLAEGATCKKLHPARAVLNGVSACLLAKAGMTGPAHILDAQDGGLYPAVSDRFDLSRLTAGLGQDYEITKIDKKPYPCCRTTHHAIDAALRLREEHGLRPEQIRSVLVETYEVGVLQCGFAKYPESPVEAKFSIPFTCAAAFARGQVTRGEFCRDLLEDPQVRRVAQATKVVSSEDFTRRYPQRWGSRMTVTLENGETLSCQVDDMSGSVAVPLSPERERDKFFDLTVPALGRRRAEALMDGILRVETLERLPDLA